MILSPLAALAVAWLSNPLLVPQTPISVPGAAGHFDFMNVDRRNRLILAAHPQNSSFTVVDLNTGAVKDVAVGCAVNGIAADGKGKRVFAAGPGKTLVAFDSTTWTKLGELALDGPADCVAYDSKHSLVYVDNDDGTNLWIVDPAQMKLVGSVTIKEAPECMEYDSNRDRIFQAIKSANVVQVIDPTAKQVVAEWTLGDLTSPHGLAIDRKAGLVFVAGKNGKLVVLDAESGAIKRTLDVVKGSDQIAYDAGLGRLYVPGGGKMSIVQVTDGEASVVDTVDAPAGCHSVTVDPKTHDVWVVYADKTASYVMKLTASK